MGPITLFDKSFLQSLSEDESVFFDKFFMTVICPSFWVETLADLDKRLEKRTPDQEVAVIAKKTPELESTLCANHSRLCLADMFGFGVPIDGRIPRPGGKHVKMAGKSGFVYEPSPEEQAFLRWQNQDFLKLERDFARSWRGTLASLNLDTVTEGLGALGMETSKCKTLLEAKALADSFVGSSETPLDRLNLAFLILGLPMRLQEQAYERWKQASFPKLLHYAPYAVYQLRVALFFHIAVDSRLLKKTDYMDISYLFYLPFCMIFVSSDKLHKRTAPMFRREDQIFLWGYDLKADLKRLVEGYRSLPKEELDRGIFKYASKPPKDDHGIVAAMWDRFMGQWREESKGLSPNREADKQLIEEIGRLVDLPAVPAGESAPELEQVSMMSIHRQIRPVRGSFRIVSEEVEGQ